VTGGGREATMRPRVVLISLQEDLEVIGLKGLHYDLRSRDVDATLLYVRGDGGDGGAAVRARVADFVREREPHLVGLSLMSPEFFRAARLTRELKQAGLDAPVVWGGFHATVAPEQCAAEADLVCVGEGEVCLRELAAAPPAWDPARRPTIPNLAWLDDGALRRNELAPLLTDLDALPVPEHIPADAFIVDGGEVRRVDRRLFHRHARYQGTLYSLTSSRGCPFACAYCCNSSLSRLYNTRKVRQRSVASLLAELERTRRDNPELEYINVQDDCFLVRNEATIREFCDEYRARIGLPFILRCIPTFLTRGKMAALKGAGLSWIMLGLQSGSDRVCREVYSRRSGREDFLRAARLVNEFRVAAYYDIILDNPFETPEDQLETVETLLDTPRPYYPQFFSLAFYPGSELYERTLREKPEAMEDCREKDFIAVRQTPLNSLTRLAGYLDRRTLAPLLRLYRRAPESAAFRGGLLAARLYSALLVEPITYFRVIRDSQDGDLVKTAQVVPNYFREGFRRYMKQYGRLSRVLAFTGLVD